MTEKQIFALWFLFSDLKVTRTQSTWSGFEKLVSLKKHLYVNFTVAFLDIFQNGFFESNFHHSCQIYHNTGSVSSRWIPLLKLLPKIRSSYNLRKFGMSQLGNMFKFPHQIKLIKTDLLPSNFRAAIPPHI